MARLAAITHDAWLPSGEGRHFTGEADANIR
jgi:hypothetical protein